MSPKVNIDPEHNCRLPLKDALWHYYIPSSISITPTTQLTPQALPVLTWSSPMLCDTQSLIRVLYQTLHS